MISQSPEIQKGNVISIGVAEARSHLPTGGPVNAFDLAISETIASDWIADSDISPQDGIIDPFEASRVLMVGDTKKVTLGFNVVTNRGSIEVEDYDQDPKLAKLANLAGIVTVFNSYGTGANFSFTRTQELIYSNTELNTILRRDVSPKEAQQLYTFAKAPFIDGAALGGLVRLNRQERKAAKQNIKKLNCRF